MQKLYMITTEWNFENMKVVGKIPQECRCSDCSNDLELVPIGGSLVCLRILMSLRVDKEPILFHSPNDFDFKAPGECIGHLQDQDGCRIVRSESKACYAMMLPEKYDSSKLKVFQEHLLLNEAVIPSWWATYDGKPLDFISYEDGETEHFSDYVRRKRQERIATVN